jgi:hypothetical protein
MYSAPRPFSSALKSRAFGNMPHQQLIGTMYVRGILKHFKYDQSSPHILLAFQSSILSFRIIPCALQSISVSQSIPHTKQKKLHRSSYTSHCKPDTSPRASLHPAPAYPSSHPSIQYRSDSLNIQSPPNHIQRRLTLSFLTPTNDIRGHLLLTLRFRLIKHRIWHINFVVSPSDDFIHIPRLRYRASRCIGVFIMLSVIAGLSTPYMKCTVIFGSLTN